MPKTKNESQTNDEATYYSRTRDRKLGQVASQARQEGWGYNMPYTEEQFDNTFDEFQATQRAHISALTKALKKLPDEKKAVKDAINKMLTGQIDEQQKAMEAHNNKIKEDIRQLSEAQAKGERLPAETMKILLAHEKTWETALKNQQAIQLKQLKNDLQKTEGITDDDQAVIIQRAKDSQAKQLEAQREFFKKVKAAQAKVMEKQDREYTLTAIEALNKDAVSRTPSTLTLSDANKNDEKSRDKLELNEQANNKRWKGPSGAEIFQDGEGAFHINSKFSLSSLLTGLHKPSTEDIRMMLLLMRAKGIKNIRLTGDPDLVRQAWMMAGSMGFEGVNIENSGFNPTTKDFNERKHYQDGFAILPNMQGDFQNLFNAMHKADAARLTMQGAALTLPSQSEIETEKEMLERHPLTVDNNNISESLRAIELQQIAAGNSIDTLKTLMEEQTKLASQIDERLKLIDGFQQQTDPKTQLPLTQDALYMQVGADPSLRSKLPAPFTYMYNNRFFTGNINPDQLIPEHAELFGRINQQDQLNEIAKDIQLLRTLDQQIRATSAHQSNIVGTINTAITNVKDIDEEDQKTFEKIQKTHETQKKTLANLDIDNKLGNTEEEMSQREGKLGALQAKFKRDLMSQKAAEEKEKETQRTSILPGFGAGPAR